MRTIPNKHFMEIMTSTFASMQKLTASKGQEYTEGRANDNQHASFDKWAVELGISPERVLGVLLNKHVASVLNYLKTADGPPKEYSEPMEGRFDDAILYMLLAKAMYVRRAMIDPANEPIRAEKENASGYADTRRSF